MCQAGQPHTWGLARSMRFASQLMLFSPIYLQPRHPRGAWRSRNAWGTLRERRNNQAPKRALPQPWGQWCEGGQAEGCWRTRGETEETSDTHLRARLPGAAHPKSRSTLGGSGGRKRRGEVTDNAHTKRRAAWGGSWLGARPCMLACGGKLGLSPWLGEGSQHHLPACRRRQGLLGRDRSTPLVHPEKTGAFVRGQGWRTFRKLTSGRQHRLLGWRRQSLNLGSASSDCALGQSVGPL